jgi:hypothetical protein
MEEAVFDELALVSDELGLGEHLFSMKSWLFPFFVVPLPHENFDSFNSRGRGSPFQPHPSGANGKQPHL